MKTIKNPFKEITEKEWEHFLIELKENNKDLDTLDINSLSKEDTTMSILTSFLREEYGITLKPTMNAKVIKNQIEKYNFLAKAEVEQQEQEAEKEFMNSLEAIEKDKTTDVIEKAYFIPKQYAKMVARGNATGFILYGHAGLGKTYSIIRAFKEEDKEFVFCSGFTTPLQMYEILYNNRTKHIIFDDVGSLLKSPIVLDILKSALYSPKGVRQVQYQTSSPKLLVPNSFVFEGTITILVNDVGDNEDLKAVADRVLFYELKLNYEQIVSILYELAKNPYKDLSKETRMEIAKWVKENTSLATSNINLRLLFKLYEMYRFDKDNWKTLAKESLIEDERIKLVNDLLKKFVSVKEAEKEFIEVTGLGRATFYRIKKRLNR